MSDKPIATTNQYGKLWGLKKKYHIIVKSKNNVQITKCGLKLMLPITTQSDFIANCNICTNCLRRDVS